ncbi:hypothetical protein V496_03389 [Pseudogymnoascus sp. VKM F-4515 (FW-2607)]|nr:hypothetical protein V496_03389 [Pseudogymnoascus sp. VKM F-4515 (FW-2607)]
MDSATMTVTGGTDRADRIPGHLTHSHMRFGKRNLDSKNSHSTPNRPSIVGTTTASSTSTSSSSTSSSTCSGVFDDDQSPVGTPLTPPDSKRIGELYTANLGKVSKLSLTGKSVYEECPSDYDHSQEPRCSSSPQLGEQDVDLEFTGSLNDVASRFSHAEIYNRSPIPLRVQRRHIEELAEALGTLSVEGNDTDTRQGPKEINKTVVSDSCRRPRPGKQQASSNATHSSSSKKKKKCSPPTSGTSSPSEEMDLRSAATEATARSITPTPTPGTTAKSSPKADLDTAAILAIDRCRDLNEGSSSTAVDSVASSKNPLKRTPGRSLKLKQHATGANAATDPITSGGGRSCTSKTTSSQSLRRRQRAKQETSTVKSVDPLDVAVVMTGEYHTFTTYTEASGCETDESDYATDLDESEQSRNSTEEACIQPQVAGLNSRPTFSHYDEEKLTGKDILDKIFGLLWYNGKRKGRQSSLKPTSQKVETKSLGYGFLYIYTSPMCPNHVKIGMTSGTPHARIKQWNGKCKLPIERVEDLKHHPFLHFQLAERLIMAELYNYRRKYECHKCHKRHIDPIKVEEKSTKNMVHHGEWYEISEELGLATVQKWRGWLATSNPYTLDGILRPGWSSKLGPFSQFIAPMDAEEWVAEWIQPLKADEVIPYFWSHSITKMSDTWSEIRNFLSLLVGLLSTLQHIGEQGLGLLPFFVRFIFLITSAFIILYWLNATYAFFFVILSIITWLWMTF